MALKDIKMSTTTTYFLLVSVCTLLSIGQLSNSDLLGHGPTDLYNLHDECSAALNEQLSLELYASIVYLNMAAYFNRPSVAKSGFAKYFEDQSKEEYAHATKFIDYINKRNGTVKRISVEESPKFEWESAKEALSDALKLEKHVLAKIGNIRNIADQKCQDPHLIDFLETEFFTEQMDSISEILRMITNLSTRDLSSFQLVEYLEDKKLLKTNDL